MKKFLLSAGMVFLTKLLYSQSFIIYDNCSPGVNRFYEKSAIPPKFGKEINLADEYFETSLKPIQHYFDSAFKKSSYRFDGKVGSPLLSTAREHAAFIRSGK